MIYSAIPPPKPPISISTSFSFPIPSPLAGSNPMQPLEVSNFKEPPNFRRRAHFQLPVQSRLGDWVGMMNLIQKVGISCFGVRSVPERKVEIESVPGGKDVMDAAAMEGKVSPEHLVVMVNGIIGSASDWKFAADQFVKKLPDKVIVHCSERNYDKLTFDGVDLMGERLADEVSTIVRHKPGLKKISFIAHSLGGLVARYAVGRLYQYLRESDHLDADGSCVSENKESLEENCNSRVAGLEPMNFITVATPHLGSRGHRQLPLLCGLSFLEQRASQTAHLIAGRSGKHLFLTDEEDGRCPLLLRMVTDSNDLKFISALRAFKRRVAYANVNYDHVVGWSTSSIRRRDELPKANLLVKDDKYPHIVHTEREALGCVFHEKSSYIQGQKFDFEEEMIRGLTQVPWERVDVSFDKSRQRYVAHNTIQVKSYWLNSDGADVIFHMIDNFLL